MKTLKFMRMLVLAAFVFGGVVLMAGGVSGLFKTWLAVLVVPLVVLLLMPKFWLGFFAGDLWRLLSRGSGLHKNCNSKGSTV